MRETKASGDMRHQATARRGGDSVASSQHGTVPRDPGDFCRSLRFPTCSWGMATCSHLALQSTCVSGGPWPFKSPGLEAVLAAEQPKEASWRWPQRADKWGRSPQMEGVNLAKREEEAVSPTSFCHF